MSTTTATNIPNYTNATLDPIVRWSRNWPDYDPGMLILAFLVAVQAAYVSVYILKFHYLRPLVVLGALTFSVGSIFCMHFIAMAAEVHAVPMAMSTGWTIGSIFFAFVPTAGAMVFLTMRIPHQLEQQNTIRGNWIAFRDAPHLTLVAGATLMALGTAAMHWTATIGMFPVGVQHYDTLWVAITCVFLLVACVIALHCCFVLPLTKELALPTAVVLSVATTGFHVWAAVLSVYVEIQQSLVQEHPMNEMRENAAYIVFLSTMLSFIAWFIATHFSRNSRAVTDETKPVTIVFTDVQSSSRLYAKIPAAMHEANEKHLKVMLSQLQRFQGHFVKSVGDSIMAVFENPRDALLFMADTQIMLNNLVWDPRINLMYTKMAMKSLRRNNNNDKESGALGESESTGHPESGEEGLSAGNNTSNSAKPTHGTSNLHKRHSISDKKHNARNAADEVGSHSTNDNNHSSTNETGCDDDGDEVAADLGGIREGAAYNGLRIRMGANIGLCSIVFDETQKTFDYFGHTTNVSARVEAAARGGQILVSRQLIDAVGGDDAVKQLLTATVESHGLYALRGMIEATELVEITPDALSLRRPFAPPNAIPADDVNLDSSNEFAALERSFLELQHNSGVFDDKVVANDLDNADERPRATDNMYQKNATEANNGHTENVSFLLEQGQHNNNNNNNQPQHQLTSFTSLEKYQQSNNNHHNHSGALNASELMARPDNATQDDFSGDAIRRRSGQNAFSNGRSDKAFHGVWEGNTTNSHNNHSNTNNNNQGADMLPSFSVPSQSGETIPKQQLEQQQLQQQQQLLPPNAKGTTRAGELQSASAPPRVTETFADEGRHSSYLNNNNNNRIIAGGSSRVSPTVNAEQQNQHVVFDHNNNSATGAVQAHKNDQQQRQEHEHPANVVLPGAVVIGANSQHSETHGTSLDGNNTNNVVISVCRVNTLNNNNNNYGVNKSFSDVDNFSPSQASVADANDSKLQQHMEHRAFGALSKDPGGDYDNNTNNSINTGNNSNHHLNGGHSNFPEVLALRVATNKITQNNINNNSTSRDKEYYTGGNTPNAKNASHSNSHTPVPNSGSAQTNSGQLHQQRHQYKNANPTEVYDFVVATVHRLVRKRYSASYVQTKLNAQMSSFEILLHKFKDIESRRRIVGEICRSWGHFTTITEHGNPKNKQFSEEEILEMEDELKCALTILAGRVLSRVLQLEVAGSMNVQAQMKKSINVSARINDNNNNGTCGLLGIKNTEQQNSKSNVATPVNRSVSALTNNNNNDGVVTVMIGANPRQ